MFSAVQGRLLASTAGITKAGGPKRSLGGDVIQSLESEPYYMHI